MEIIFEQIKFFIGFCKGCNGLRHIIFLWFGEKQIENKMADRQTTTAKRLAQANNSRFEGARLQRTQDAIFRLADLHDACAVPENLQWVKTKADVYDNMGEGCEQVPNGYHSYMVGDGKPHSETPEAMALWGLLVARSDEEIKADELRQKVEGLQFSKIPGYFPTPDPVIKQMIEFADIQPEHRVLEPNLGSGAIADAVKPLCSEVKGFEINHTLAEICDAKEYLIEQRDFLEVLPEEITSYERILMNPPFEKLQDIDHVMHAIKMLKPGGRLVSIMSPGPFFRTDNKSTAFRNWLYEETEHQVIDLPPGAFKASGTGVASKMVVIET